MIRFVKVHGLGNDFVLIDGVRESVSPDRLQELARPLCDRRTGVGADGVLLAERIGTNHFRMRMWNPDGSESEMCGNGIRCLAKFLRDEGHATIPTVAIETGAGRLEPTVREDGLVRVDMGKPKLNPAEIGMAGVVSNRFLDEAIKIEGYEGKGSAVSMGNPHLVLFVPDVGAIPLEVLGPRLEHHPYFPSRTNVHFVQVLDRRHVRQTTWERGAGATLACGTGACAVAVAAAQTGRCEEQVVVTLPGGDLEIEARSGESVFMTGPAIEVFRGVWNDVASKDPGLDAGGK